MQLKLAIVLALFSASAFPPVVAATPVDQVERNDKRGDNVLDQTMEQSSCNPNMSGEEVCSIVVVSGGSTISTILTTETGTGFSNGFGTATGIFQSQSISFGSSPTQSTSSATATSQGSGSSATTTFSQSQSSGGDMVAVSPTVAVTLLTSVGAVVWMIL